MKKIGLFAAGVLFGTTGIKLLGSKDAKKVYAHTTAAALRAKEGVMKTVTAVREGAEDVYADAKAINECRDRFHHTLLGTQCGSSGVGVDFLGILAAQQLNACRSEQHACCK